MGVDALELVPGKLLPSWPEILPEELRVARENLRRTGIEEYPAMQAILFGHPQAHIFHNPILFRDAILNAGRLARELGCSRLVWGAPGLRKRGETTREKATNMATSILRQTAEGLAALDVILMMENNPVEYGCDWGTTPDEVLDIVRAVGHPNLQLHLDIGGLKGTSPEPWLSHAAHIHVSEMNLKPFQPSAYHVQTAEMLRGAGVPVVSLEMLPHPSGLDNSIRQFVNIYGG
jgi:sugar phosphate isomerase/epimerase